VSIRHDAGYSFPKPSKRSVMQNNDITVDVALYGPVARAAGGHHIATRSMRLTAASTMGDLTAHLGLDGGDIGYVFVNAVLCDVPGLNVSQHLELQDGDHIGIFSRVHMWPYQYRDGVRMSPALKEALKERGAMHHTYSKLTESEGS
jgi:hypothetical protein